MPQATEKSLKQQLMEGLGLTEDDFQQDGSDLRVRADDRVMPWLKQNFSHWTIVQSFRHRGPLPSTGRWPEGFYEIPHQ